MVTSLKNLKNEVDSRLAGGGLTDLACCQLQNAQTILNNNIVTSVANVASLPSNTLNEGRFVYVEDINEYRLANDASWTDDVSSGICIYQTQIWAWGNNYCGRLGDGTITSKCSPIREICSATDWCQVSAGFSHSVAVKASGQIWSWGQNACFKLGLGDAATTNFCSPVREFCSATDWCKVSTGCLHTMAIKTSGQIWGWGVGQDGRLGDGTTVNKCSPVREICSATDWCQVSARSLHTVALKTSGELWVWGSASCGRLGDGTVGVAKCSPIREICSATDWCQVNAGYVNTIAIKTSGQIWAWGLNNCGNLGDGTTTTRCSPVREICSATDWCEVKAGCFHAAAIKTSGELWAWGSNFCGLLGDGTTVNRCSPVREFCSATNWCQVSASSSQTAAIKTSGQIWSWGGNSAKQLGDGTSTARCSPVREFCSATDWCQVSTGAAHSAAIKSVAKGFLE